MQCPGLNNHPTSGRLRLCPIIYRLYSRRQAISKQRVRVKVNAASSKGSWSSSVSLDQVGDPDLLTVDGVCICNAPSALEAYSMASKKTRRTMT
jgi:hypothetical protein